MGGSENTDELSDISARDFAKEAPKESSGSNDASAASTQEAPSRSGHGSDGDDGAVPPPLPPRPTVVRVEHEQSAEPVATVESRSNTLRPRLHTKTTTTAVDLTDVFAHSITDSGRKTLAPSTAATAAQSRAESVSELSRSTLAESLREREHGGPARSVAGDSSSIRSYIPTLEATDDVESLLGEVLSSNQGSPAWKPADARARWSNSWRMEFDDNDGLGTDFAAEFQELEELAGDGTNEASLMHRWRSRLKQFFVLSSAGKPIFSRHGDDALVSGYVGVLQTVISSFQHGKEQLRGFTAGSVRFVVVIEGPLYLVAISQLGESDTQLRAQLDALYMQILSTLTLPTLTSLFSHRPSMDLRRPLQGTEPLLAALADSFTRGSPSTLLSALECLRLGRSQREQINNVVLGARASSLLYGLIVAGGRLVSVVRPRRHSLRPSDLQLIFNMLDATGGLKASEGENWIPICLPAFNNRGYLYMYVSFVDQSAGDGPTSGRGRGRGQHDDEGAAEEVGDGQIAILLISTEKERFYELKQMRDEVVQQLERNGSMHTIRSAIRRGRPSVDDVVPGSVLRHFLYKSRRNVQFVTSSFSPEFSTMVAHRRLLTIYHTLHATVHAKNAHLKALYRTRPDCVCLGWVTPVFEMYCIGGTVDGRAVSRPSTTTPNADGRVGGDGVIGANPTGGNAAGAKATEGEVPEGRHHEASTTASTIADDDEDHIEPDSFQHGADDAEQDTLKITVAADRLQPPQQPPPSSQETRTALVLAANHVVRWIEREEERLFIVGGAVSSTIFNI